MRPAAPGLPLRPHRGGVRSWEAARPGGPLTPLAHAVDRPTDPPRDCPTWGAAALLGWLGLAAPEARAACGDYVTVVRRGDHPAPDQTRPGRPATPGCHGPGCSAPPVQAGPIAAPRMTERPVPGPDGGRCSAGFGLARPGPPAGQPRA